MSYVSQQRTPLWSLELYALGVPPVWAAWVLVLRRADYVWSGRCGWHPGPVRHCQALPCRKAAGCWWVEPGAGCRAPGDPGASAGSLMDKAGSQREWTEVVNQLYLNLKKRKKKVTGPAQSQRERIIQGENTKGGWGSWGTPYVSSCHNIQLPKSGNLTHNWPGDFCRN